ncbi:BLUF domain-containing protein [Sphingomonas oligophenolica]|uniref:BLUF domain-containing protein n=1 Tax=Sphingomonas oligophenolica TaxID=301154 RepID=A0A502CIL3_9SPHN|nr:BLUF domain-containing protein [Sphingomonas oligophenolica]TPG12490.1 BLUF domain-containing protein [Sphingomonas oligophenolica]
MYRLLYISTARQIITTTQLGAILSVSRRNNAAVGVTGLLVAGGKRFLQALEGEEEAVRTVVERIRLDPRHIGIATLASGPITERAFPNWSMGHQAGGDVLPGTSIANVLAALIAPIEDPSLRAYFTGFAELHAAA